MADATATTSTSPQLPTTFNALSSSDHVRHMRRAISLSREAGIEKRTGGCFGAVLVDSNTGRVLGEGHNRVLETRDPTAHGEICCLREACSRLGSPHLPEGSVCYTSAEPCPMCHGALLWARCSKVFYAATHADVRKLGKFDDVDFAADIARRVEEKKRKEELMMTAETEAKTKPQQPALIGIEQMLREEALEVWREYASLPDTERY